MTRLIRRRRLRAYSSAAITLIYVAAAVVLGVEIGALGSLFDHRISPMSSSSTLAILSSIASGMLALTAIVFSLLMVGFQLGQTSYSPRLLRLLRDNTFIGHAIGVFAGTFMYSLLAIRTIDLGGAEGVRMATATVAMGWLFASIVMLVLLMPRLATLAIGSVLEMLHHRALAVIDRVYPAQQIAVAARPPARPITSTVRYTRSLRYIVGFDLPRLVAHARAADAVIVIPRAIGSPVAWGDNVLEVRGASHPVAADALLRTVWLARERSLDNDPSYAIRLLVDIAIRALSPAVNDPTTAVNVLDDLDGLLRRIGQRPIEANTVADEDGVIRVVRKVPSWDDLIALAFTEIHQYGRDSFQVERRLATILDELLDVLPPARHAAIARFARWRARSIETSEGWLDPSGHDHQGIGLGLGEAIVVP